MKKNKGFTLVELLAVIVIIGILSVITIVSVSRLISKSKNEQLKQQKNTIAMAAENYMQSNRVFLPKAIGQTTTVKVETLKKKGYLKEVVKNANGEPCMTESFVKVYKASATKYKYTTYLYCGKEKAPVEDEVEKPSIKIQFIDSNEQEITESNPSALNDVATARFKVTYKGGTTKDIEIDGYSYAILVDTDATAGDLKEVYNSGTLNGNGNTTIVVKKYISDYLDITKATKVKVRATAINKDGGILDETIALGEQSPSGQTTYNDKIPPVCSTISGQAKEGVWVNKKSYNANPNANSRTIEAECSDGNGSGCIRGKFTKTFPNQQVKSIEYGYITVVDNAGNKSTPISDDSINSNNICDTDLDTDNKCLVRINVDIVAPTIELDAYALKQDGKTLLSNTSMLNGAQKKTGDDDKGTIKSDQYKNLDGIKTNVKWMNAESNHYPGGVLYKVHLHDDLHLASWKWETNPGNILSTNNNYSSFSDSNSDAVKETQIPDNNPNINCGARDRDIEIGFRTSGMRRGRLTVTDKAGNVATYIIEANLDTTVPKAPNVSYLYTNNNSTYPVGAADPKSPWTKIKIKTNVATNGSMGVSGFAKFDYKYYKNNRTNSTPGECSKNNSTCFTFGDEGTSYIQYSACNQAGTCSEFTDKSLNNRVRYDISPPTGLKIVGNNGSVASGNWAGGSTKSIKTVASGAVDAYSGGVYYIYGSNANISPTSNKGKTNTYTRSTDGVETVYFKACDKLDNCSAAEKFVMQLDLRAPDDSTTTITGYKIGSNGTVSSKTWVGGPNVSGVKVQASGTKDRTPGSGFKEYKYSSDGDENHREAVGTYLNITSSGSTTVKVVACDKVGNCSSGKTFVVKLDKEAPPAPSITTYAKSSTSNFTCGGAKCGHITRSNISNSVKTAAGSYTLTHDTWAGGKNVKGVVSIASDVNDVNSGSIAGSGFDHYVVTKDDSTVKEQPFINTNKDGTHTIKFKACDKVGNCSSNTTFKIKLDITAPSCVYKKTSTGTGGVSGTISCSDSPKQSGCNTSYNASSFGPIYSGTSTTVYDNAGNYSSCSVSVSSSSCNCHSEVASSYICISGETCKGYNASYCPGSAYNSNGVRVALFHQKAQTTKNGTGCCWNTKTCKTYKTVCSTCYS